MLPCRWNGKACRVAKVAAEAWVPVQAWAAWEVWGDTGSNDGDDNAKSDGQKSSHMPGVRITILSNASNHHIS